MGVLAALYGMQAQLEAMYPCGPGQGTTGVNWKDVAIGVGIGIGITVLAGFGGLVGGIGAGLGLAF